MLILLVSWRNPHLSHEVNPYLALREVRTKMVDSPSVLFVHHLFSRHLLTLLGGHNGY
jgi:hypothetical protein